MNQTMEATPKKGKAKKILLICLALVIGLIIIAAAVVWGIWHNEISSVLSLKQISTRNDDHLDGSVYQMNISGGYYFDEYLEQGGAWTWPGVREALWQALRGHTHYHLWFLYMILGLYLVTPVLRAFVRGAGRGDFHWFFLLVFVFTFLLPTLLRLRPSQTASLWIGNLNLHLVLGYVGYYVLGYYLKQNTLSRAAEFALYLLGALGAAVTVGGTALLSRQRGELVQVFYNYDSPNVALMSVAVFVLFRYVLGVSEERSRRERLSKAAQVSFGIYLVHDLFLMLLRRVGIDALSFAPALAVPVLAAGIFLCSFAVAWVLSKIPLVGRYLT